VIGKRALFALAARDESNPVWWNGAASAGRDARPAGAIRARALARRNWTLLVNGVNLHRCAERLLRRFSFIPQARLDDVMVSYAAPGGGVGPHFDSYDVFLVQGAGRGAGACARRALRPGARRPAQADRRFRAEQEVVLEPGDLLYLPPGWGHDGVALDACFTCSVGFRAPRGAELAAAFLDHLHERGLPDAATATPACGDAHPRESAGHARFADTG
jgi:50S ribosomal protein L16 3-hydroxylase